MGALTPYPCRSSVKLDYLLGTGEAWPNASVGSASREKMSPDWAGLEVVSEST